MPIALPQALQMPRPPQPPPPLGGAAIAACGAGVAGVGAGAAGAGAAALALASSSAFFFASSSFFLSSSSFFFCSSSYFCSAGAASRSSAWCCVPLRKPVTGWLRAFALPFVLFPLALGAMIVGAYGVAILRFVAGMLEAVAMILRAVVGH